MSLAPLKLVGTALPWLILGGPVVVGLAGLMGPAFGLSAMAGDNRWSLGAWRQLWQMPGLAGAVWLSLSTGLGAALVATALAFALSACWHGRGGMRWLRRGLAPILALPHAAFAIGFAFLIAPTGWLARAASPSLTGWQRPPTDLVTVGDPAGFALMAALAIKETAFLLLMILAALGSIDSNRRLLTARSLGYAPVAAWAKALAPEIYHRIRLPVYAVIAYGVSVVDMAMILGPQTPPTLAVMIFRWFNDPDTAIRAVGAAASLLQTGLVIGAIGLWRIGEMLAARVFRGWLSNGQRRLAERLGPPISLAAMGVMVAVAAGALALLALWSVAGGWRFPALLPTELGLTTWQRAADTLSAPLRTTLITGLAATALGMMAVIATLAATPGRNSDRPSDHPWGLLIFLPLLAPQIGFLFGLQVWAVRLRLDATMTALVFSHLIFVLPYLFIALADPWRRLDPRYERVARTLGAGAFTALVRVRLGLLIRPLLTAAALGFSVSVAQYLPTMLLGGGRLTTLATEAVTLAASGDRRLVGLYGVVQAILPLAGFAGALALAGLMTRNRRGVRA